MKSPARERRAAPRTGTAGPVWIREMLPGSAEIPGTLVDTSRDGFRASFSGEAPAAGTNVEFRTQTRQGTPVEMWNRCVGSQQESGFLIS